jgi:hypothetical protein
MDVGGWWGNIVGGVSREWVLWAALPGGVTAAGMVQRRRCSVFGGTRLSSVGDVPGREGE